MFSTGLLFDIILKSKIYEGFYNNLIIEKKVRVYITNFLVRKNKRIIIFVLALKKLKNIG